MTGEHMQPKFLSINPQHSLPTLVDGDLILNESRPIVGYLVNKYGKNDELYPKDPVLRAKVDQRLYFDTGTEYLTIADLSLLATYSTMKACRIPGLDLAQYRG